MDKEKDLRIQMMSEKMTTRERHEQVKIEELKRHMREYEDKLDKRAQVNEELRNALRNETLRGKLL